MKKTLCLLACLTAFHSLYAQVEAALDSIVVYENRISTSYLAQNRNVTVLDKKQIATLPVQSAIELLGYVSGVDLQQRNVNGVQADVRIDGSTFDQVLVLVNGIKMSDPQTGHHLLNISVPLTAIERIEILRGPAARTYGINALAGVINIVTRTSEQTELLGQAYAGSSLAKDSSGTSYTNWGIQATAGWNKKTTRHNMSVAHDRGNGYRYNTAFSTSRLLYTNRLQLGKKNSLEILGGYIHNDFGAALFYAPPNDIEAVEKVQTVTGSIKHTVLVNDRLTISPRISYRYNNDDYIYTRKNPELYHNIHETKVWTAETQASLRLRKGIAGAGIEFRNEQINSSNLGKRHRDNLGIYAEYRHFFSAAWDAHIGVFANYNSDYDWKLYPGLDIGYQIHKQLRLFISATTGQRIPTYTDLYYEGPGNIGNPALRPELATGLNGGLQYHHPAITARFSYFNRHTTGFIDWVKDSITAPWQPANFRIMNVQGASIHLLWNISSYLKWSDRHQLGMSVQYTYLSPRLEESTEKISKYTVDAFRHQLVASVSSTWWKRFQLNVNGRYLYRIEAGDYTIFDLRMTYLFPGWNIYFDLSNLTNTQYREVLVIPMPGRWYTAGVRFHLQSDGKP